MIYFDNQEVSLKDFEQKLTARDARGSLIIKADQKAPYELLVQVMTIGINKGFSVILATSEEP